MSCAGLPRLVKADTSRRPTTQGIMDRHWKHCTPKRKDVNQLQVSPCWKGSWRGSCWDQNFLLSSTYSMRGENWLKKNHCDLWENNQHSEGTHSDRVDYRKKNTNMLLTAYHKCRNTTDCVLWYCISQLYKKKKSKNWTKSILQVQKHLNINVSWHNKIVILLKVGPNCSYFTN